MKPFARLLSGCVLVAVLGFAGCASRPIAKVNGTPISRDAFYQGLQNGTGLSEEFQTGRIVLDTMIGITLIEKEAAKQNLTVTPEELTQGLDDYKKSIQASTNLSLEEFMKKTGTSKEAIDSRVKLTILLKKLIVSDLEVEEYFKAHTKDLNKPEQYTFLEVLFPNQEEAIAFRKQILDKKQDFFTGAQEWQKSGKQILPPPEGVKRIVAADKLGDLGATLKEILLALKPGEISEPKEIEISFQDAQQQMRKGKAWALVSLESHDPAVTASLDNSRDKIRQQLFLQKSYSGEVANYVNTLKSRARIEITDPAYTSLADDYKELAKSMPKPNLPAHDHEHEQGQTHDEETGTEAAPH